MHKINLIVYFTNISTIFKADLKGNKTYFIIRNLRNIKLIFLIAFSQIYYKKTLSRKVIRFNYELLIKLLSAFMLILKILYILFSR